MANYGNLLAILLCVGCVTGMIMLFSMFYLTHKIYPEIGMVVNSQCNNPLQGWTGTVGGIHIWSSQRDNNRTFSTYHDRTVDRRLRAVATHSGNVTSNDFVRPNSFPLVIWGSHHKTGTFLAQKLFAAMCSRMHWCCLFHITRDNLHAIRHSLDSQPVHLLGHTQWLWLPEELGVPYKFVHFYRHPYKKIVSGYRYHKEGSEEWCKKPLFYSHACKFAHLGRASSLNAVVGSDLKAIDVGAAFADKGKRGPGKASRTPLTREDVQTFCGAVHLCESCCRREHELHSIVAWDRAVKMGPRFTTKASHYKIGQERNYATRSHAEYEFICDNLKGVNVSLMHTLESLPVEEGIRVEAAIDYYESLRMAQIISHTRNDPNTLNIDLDYFMSHYSETVWKIVKLIDFKESEDVINSIVSDSEFYDINNSPLYRMSMSNPLFNHVDPNRAEHQVDLADVIHRDESIVRLYAPIIRLMGYDEQRVAAPKNKTAIETEN